MKLVNVFAEEYFMGEMEFATWLRGFFDGGTFYGVKCSLSNLLEQDDVIIVEKEIMTKNKDGSYSFIVNGYPFTIRKRKEVENILWRTLPKCKC